MYINFWYPVALSDEVTDDKPLQVQILGLKFIAFRDSDGDPHVLSDTCIHRGGSLGKGWVKAGHAICPYHGWEYGGDGKCTKIPTQAEGHTPPARAKVDSYPTEEQYGILFAFLGDLPEAERPPLYGIPEFDDDDWRANKVIAFEVNAYYERSIENGLDAAHNEFVHPLQGAPSITPTLQKLDIDIDEFKWGSNFFLPFGGSTQEDSKVLGAGEGSTSAGSEHHGPNTLITRIHFAADKAFHQYFFEAPIDDSHTRIYFVNMRKFLLEAEMDDKLVEMNMKIAHEDIRIIESLDPVRTPDSTTKELLTPADKPILAYRKYLKGWEQRGWCVDQQSMREQRGNVAFAIPSPGRRKSKSWVLDTVPLVPASETTGQPRQAAQAG